MVELVRRVLVVCVALAVLGLTTGCGAHRPESRPESHDRVPSSTATASASGPGIPQGVVMSSPAKLAAPAVSPDILVTSRSTIADSTAAKLAKIPGVVAADHFALAQFYSEERSVTYAAVDPATFRRFTPAATAAYTDVWDRVADGEMAAPQKLARSLETSAGYVRMGDAATSPEVHVGAYADFTPPLAARTFVDAVVNAKWVPRLHMVPGNAVVLSTGSTAPEGVAEKVRAVVGGDVSVSILAHSYDLKAVQTAVVTGTSVARAIGHYTYTANANGTVNPDPAWVRTYIRTEQVPILGTVTCNKIMLPELRAALSEIQNAGLASKVYHYDGCFVPRFINHNPADGLSNHSFGTAIDINAAANQRGGRGQMDIRVVRIFEKWGFTWGGTWHYTDPMHFELNKIVKVG